MNTLNDEHCSQSRDSAMLQSVLLVGGSGFLGLHLIEQFSKHCPETQIHVFDVMPLPTLSKYFTFDKAKVTFHKGDITNEADVAAAVKAAQCDVVVHLASPIHGRPQHIYEKVNVEGTSVLLQVCRASAHVRALVYTSSAGVVFNGADVYNANELWPYPAVHMDGYNETKATAEKAVMEANSDNLYTVCLRPAGIFGPGDRQLVPGLRTAARLGQSKFQLGDNTNLFDWTYAGNVADAHVLAARQILTDASQIGGETFFITNDAPTYFWTLARTVWKADGHIDKYNIVLPRPVAIVAGYLSQFVSGMLGKEPGLTAFRAKITCATRYHDISKAKTLLGYTPAVSLEEGIQHTLEWIHETHT